MADVCERSARIIINGPLLEVAHRSYPERHEPLHGFRDVGSKCFVDLENMGRLDRVVRKIA